jgi:hypothetical protein
VRINAADKIGRSRTAFASNSAEKRSIVAVGPFLSFAADKCL